MGFYLLLVIGIMDSSEEAEFLRSECRRLCEKMKAAERRGAMRDVRRWAAEVSSESKVEEK